jgi:NADPH:quinone reductase-like Zn-dependent oxidoreductase
MASTAGKESIMKACIIEKFGGRERLQIADMDKPEPGEGEVLVRIQAAGVNPVDWKIRQGLLKDLIPHHFPLILGWDMAGVVEATGHAARRFKPGDEVYAYARRPEIQKGTYAEYIALPESYIARKPKGLSLPEAGSIPLTALTAYQSLFDAGQLQKGQSVFILEASGGVGSSAVQLAAAAGARVVGLASTPNHDYLKSLGAESVIDYRQDDFDRSLFAILPQGADLVFDCHGGATLARGQRCARPGGRLVSIAEQVDEAQLKERDVRFFYVFVEPHARQLDRIGNLVESGRFKPQVSRTFALDQAAQAHEQMETGHTRGKIVLQVSA